MRLVIGTWKLIAALPVAAWLVYLAANARPPESADYVTYNYVRPSAVEIASCEQKIRPQPSREQPSRSSMTNPYENAVDAVLENAARACQSPVRRTVPDIKRYQEAHQNFWQQAPLLALLPSMGWLAVIFAVNRTAPAIVKFSRRPHRLAIGQRLILIFGATLLATVTTLAGYDSHYGEWNLGLSWVVATIAAVTMLVIAA